MQEVEPKVEGVGLMRERECNCGILRYYIVIRARPLRCVRLDYTITTASEC